MGGNALLGGFGDEIGAALFTPVEAAIGAWTGEDAGKSLQDRIMDGYSRGLRSRRDLMAYAQEQHPIASTAGTVAGGVMAGAGLAKAGLSMAANAAQKGAGLGRVATGSTVDGAALGALYGAGESEGYGRVSGAVQGALTGGALGLAAPYAIAGATAAAKPLMAPVMARVRPVPYAEAALSTAVRRSGQTPVGIIQAMEDAHLDGQDMFTLADALGNSGQRALSSVARSPNDARQTVIETITDRQSDQGRRVAGALSDASGSPLTAAQYRTQLEQARSEAAGIDYRPVHSETAAIDVSEPVARANAVISPLADQHAVARGAVPTDLAIRAPIEAGEAQIRDPIRSAVRDARSYLAADGLTVTNVGQAFRAKTNIDQMIASATANQQGGTVAALMPIQQSLDDALARTSKTYAAARDAYRDRSIVIDAIDTGRDMSASRTRVADNIEAFSALPSEQVRQAARVGYFDPRIARAESQAGSMSNSARPLLSESGRQELPRFAAPGTAPQLMRRLGREQRMFETASAATGGSKTADNVADLEDMASFDPAMIPRLLRGDMVGAGMAAMTKALNEAKGLPPRVLEQLGSALMETDPNAARRLLSAATTKSLNAQGRKKVAVTVLNSIAAPAAGRARSP